MEQGLQDGPSQNEPALSGSHGIFPFHQRWSVDPVAGDTDAPRTSEELPELTEAHLHPPIFNTYTHFNFNGTWDSRR